MEWYALILVVFLLDSTLGTYDEIKDESDENQLMRIPVGPVPRASLRQIFHDDFNHIDHNRWEFDASASMAGFAFYTPEHQNCYTKDGKMYLKPTLVADHFGENFLHHGVLDFKQKYGYCSPTWNNGCHHDASRQGIINPVMSCFMRSKTSFRYGKVEFRAKFPRGDWLWPALWMMPKTGHYGGWPKSGEIDMAETIGNTNYGNLGVGKMSSSLHFGVDSNQDKHVMGQHFLHGTTYADGMYKYVLDWTADHINIYVNEVHMLSVPTPGDGMYHHYGMHGNNVWNGAGHNAPFDQEFYLIMSVGAGGLSGIFPDGVRNYPHAKSWSTHDSKPAAMEKFWQHRNEWHPTWHGEDAAMQVDYVTIWTY